MATVGLETVCARDYERPFELHATQRFVFKLQATDLVPPQTYVDARLQHWGLLVCPTEHDVPSKTQAFDESAMLDSPWMTWAGPWIAALRHQPQNHPIWPFHQVAHTNNFHSTAARANVVFLRVEPNSLRHGGASHDALTGHRNLAHNKARGRWRADCSVQHHKKETRALQRFVMLDPTPSKNHSQHCLHNQHGLPCRQTSVLAGRVQTKPAKFQTTPYVPGIVRLRKRTGLAGTQWDCRSAYPASDL